MEKINLNWTEFKQIVIQSKKLGFNEITNGDYYTLLATEDGVFLWQCQINKITDTDNKLDYETNYQIKANQALHPIDEDGKLFSRAESRPIDMTTYFTTCGDKISVPQFIGNGQPLKWDFTNSDNEITAETGYKKKRIEFQFIDAIRVKEGSIYFRDTLFDSFLDLYIVCPAGNYYLNNDKTPILASEDTPVEHFVNKHYISGTCSTGDELNTEAASLEIPSNYKFWLEITVPESDVISKGYVSIECYRKRTIIL